MKLVLACLVSFMLASGGAPAQSRAASELARHAALIERLQDGQAALKTRMDELVSLVERALADRVGRRDERADARERLSRLEERSRAALRELDSTRDELEETRRALARSRAENAVLQRRIHELETRVERSRRAALRIEAERAARRAGRKRSPEDRQKRVDRKLDGWRRNAAQPVVPKPGDPKQEVEAFFGKERTRGAKPDSRVTEQEIDRRVASLRAKLADLQKQANAWRRRGHPIDEIRTAIARVRADLERLERVRESSGARRRE